MAKKSIGELHAKVTADATQFVDEFKRADNASRRSSTAINAEVDKLTKGIKKKFELADFGKDILKGAGLFGGFQLAETAAAAIVGHYKEAADAAKRIEDSTARQLANTLAMIRERRSSEEQIAFLSRDIASKQDRLDQFNNPNNRKFTVFNRDGTKSTLIADQTPEQKEAIGALTEEIQTLTAARKKLSDTVVEAAEKERAAMLSTEERERESDKERKIKALTAGIDAQEAAFTALIETQKKANEESAKTNAEAQKLADKYRDLADPMREYKQNLAEIATLEASGKLLYDDAWKAKVEIWSKMAEAANKAKPGTDYASLKEISPDQLKAADDAMRGIQLNALETERIVGRAADGMADAWVDSLRGVEGAWSNLADSIINEILRVVAQLLIVKPIINSIGGVFSGLGWGTLGAAFTGYGGGKAMGGGVDAGVTYRVNEHGQEFFKSNTGGTIIPAGISSSMTAKASGGATYFIDATGADAGKIAQLENTIRSLNGSIEHRAVAGVIAAKRRGGGTSLALA